MTVKQAVDSRRSTRYYDLDKKVSKEDMDIILDAGRKAPNGLALEAWKFIVLTGDFSKIAEATYGQPHIQDASHVVALVNYKHEYIMSNPEVITDLLVSKGFTQDKAENYLTILDARGTQYYREQTMFAASQMSLQAAGLEIGSVIVGGFDALAMAKAIGLDTDKFEVALVVDFGYPKQMETKARVLRNREDVVEYIEL